MAYVPPPRYPPSHAYRPNYEQNSNPLPIGFQNFVSVNPNGVDNSTQSAYPPTSVRYHGDNDMPAAGNEVLPEVGFEGYLRDSNGQTSKSSAKSSSGVELENIEDSQETFVHEDSLPDRSVRDKVCLTFQVRF